MKKDASKIMTIAAREELAARLSDSALKVFAEKVKGASDDDAGSFEVVVSTADPDRQGDTIDQAKWDLSMYKMNPVVLWGHDYYSLPIGLCESIEVDDKGNLVAKGKFAPASANPFAQQVRQLYDSKIVRATSVGYIPAGMRMDGKDAEGNELLEFSFVPVPANAYALSLRDMQAFEKKGIDFAELLLKGIRFTKAAQAGDSCQMDDGTLGTYGEASDGTLICQPKEDRSAKSDDDEQPNSETAEEALREDLKAEHGRHTDEVSKCIDKFMKAMDSGEMTDDEKEDQKSKALKIGATISRKNKSKLNETLTHLEAASATIKELIGSDEGEPDGDEPEGDDEVDGDAADGPDKGKSSRAKEIDIFYFSRDLLKSVATTVNETLEKANEKHRELTGVKKHGK